MNQVRTTIIIIIGLFFTLALTATAADRPNHSARKYFKKGMAAYEKADYQAARKNFESAIEEYPDYAEAYYTLGRISLSEQEIQQALTHFSKAVEIDPGLRDAQLELGRIYLAARIPEKAMVRAGIVLKEDPGNLQAVLIKGSALMAQDRVTQAVEFLKPLFDKGDRDRNLILLLAGAYVRSGHAAQGESVLKAGIEKHSQDISLHLQLADLYLRAAELKAAQAVMETVMKIEPGRSAHALSLARLYWETKDTRKAEKLLTRIIEDKPADSNQRIAVANFYLERQRMDQAQTLLQQGIASGDPGAHLRLALGELYLKTGRTQKAVDMLKAGLESVSGPDDAERINLQNALANIYLAAKDNASAEKYTQNILDLDPDNLRALVTRGMAAKAAGQPHSAIRDFKRVLGLKPKYLQGYIQLADAYVMNRQVPQSREILKQGLRLAPTDPKMLMAMYRVCLMDKDYKQAERHLRFLVEKNPDATAAQALLGDFYLELNDEDAARREYSEIVLKSSRSPVGYTRLARLYLRQNKIDSAILQLRKGYARVEKNQSIAADLTALLLSAQRFDEALALCDARLAKNPSEAFAHNLKGETFTKMKKYEQARKSFEKAAAIEPLWPEASNNLAALYLMQGKIKAAIKNLETALKQNPKNAAAYLTLAKIYEKENKYTKAIEIYEQAVKNVPRFWAAANNLAFMLCQYRSTEKELERAHRLALAAYQLQPGRADIIDTIAWINYHQGNFDQALTLLQKINEQVMDNPMYSYHLSMALLKTGKDKEAMTRLEVALKDKTVFHGRSDAEKTLKNLKSKG